MSRLVEWFERESEGAPGLLRDRAAQYLEGRAPEGDPALELSAAATDALRATLAHDGGRDVALDLLAADALVTLALKARATMDPATLGAFAATLRTAGSGSR